jgi:hypothetical protein
VLYPKDHQHGNMIALSRDRACELTASRCRDQPYPTMRTEQITSEYLMLRSLASSMGNDARLWSFCFSTSILCFDAVCR